MRILVIEDNLDHFLLIEDAFSPAVTGDVYLQHKITLKKGLECLDVESYDVFLCDLKLSDSTIDNTVSQLQQLDTTAAIIVLTSFDNIEIAKNLLQHGIQDYLPKNEITPSLLHRICAHAIERKQQQTALRNHNADMQTFCASLSHDFKGHIRRISQFACIIPEQLGNRIELTKNELEYFSILENNTKVMSKLVENLHQFFSVAYAEKKYNSVNLNNVISDVIGIIEDTNEKKFIINLKNSFPCVEGNESLLLMLFQNLISNSIKYNKNIPTINISSQILSEESKCNIVIEDNGIGIDEKYQKQIFFPFKRLHTSSKEYSGSGLGLSIAKRIVENHHGTIVVDSRLEVGSRFTITLLLANN